MNKLIILLLISIFLSGCGVAGIGEGYQEAQERTLKTDPCRYEFGDLAKRRCEARIRGKVGTGDGTLMGMFKDDDSSKNNSSNSYTVNKWLWSGTIKTLEDFPLKIADAFGGLVETDWLINPDTPNSRCAVKVIIKSKEFVSNGVSAHMMCQKKSGSDWALDNRDLTKENREIENAILNFARKDYLAFSG
ncbi:DUF3576 domain-containing protein [Alphaproteobacteria bacterium]|jgi:hypothetical protein|nr:DUF3576 domain-containing protein [Alphaproteobacteria bacterium]